MRRFIFLLLPTLFISLLFTSCEEDIESIMKSTQDLEVQVGIDRTSLSLESSSLIPSLNNNAKLAAPTPAPITLTAMKAVIKITNHSKGNTTTTRTIENNDDNTAWDSFTITLTAGEDYTIDTYIVSKAYAFGEDFNLSSELTDKFDNTIFFTGTTSFTASSSVENLMLNVSGYTAVIDIYEEYVSGGFRVAAGPTSEKPLYIELNTSKNTYILEKDIQRYYYNGSETTVNLLVRYHFNPDFGDELIYDGTVNLTKGKINNFNITVVEPM